MSESIDARVREIIINELGVEPEKVTDDASFVEDLGADSLDTVELVMAFEEEFGLDIPDEDAPFYYMFDSHRADNMQTLPWNPYAGKPMTIGEGIHWILNQKERETKKRPRR